MPSSMISGNNGSRWRLHRAFRAIRFLPDMGLGPAASSSSSLLKLSCRAV